MDKVLTEIQKLGFSQYESKAYVALLRHAPVTGYELSKRSGVPRSMIYEVINKLIDKGAVYTIPSDPLKYSPVAAQEFLQRVRRNINNTFSFLDQALGTLQQIGEVDVITHIHGYEPVMNELLSIVDHAAQALWLSVWYPQSSVIESHVQAVQQKNVNVFSIVFGDKDCQLGTTFHHDYMTADVVQERIGGNLTIAARDQDEVVIANFVDSTACWAVKTHDPALVLVAIEFIRHDIMIEAITRHFGPSAVDMLWRNNPALRYVVEGLQKV